MHHPEELLCAPRVWKRHASAGIEYETRGLLDENCAVVGSVGAAGRSGCWSLSKFGVERASRLGLESNCNQPPASHGNVNGTTNTVSYFELPDLPIIVGPHGCTTGVSRASTQVRKRLDDREGTCSSSAVPVLVVVILLDFLHPGHEYSAGEIKSSDGLCYCTRTRASQPHQFPGPKAFRTPFRTAE